MDCGRELQNRNTGAIKPEILRILEQGGHYVIFCNKEQLSRAGIENRRRKMQDAVQDALQQGADAVGRLDFWMPTGSPTGSIVTLSPVNSCAGVLACEVPDGLSAWNTWPVNRSTAATIFPIMKGTSGPGNCAKCLPNRTRSCA